MDLNSMPRHASSTIHFKITASCKGKWGLCVPSVQSLFWAPPSCPLFPIIPPPLFPCNVPYFPKLVCSSQTGCLYWSLLFYYSALVFANKTMWRLQNNLLGLVPCSCTESHPHHMVFLVVWWLGLFEPTSIS